MRIESFLPFAVLLALFGIFLLRFLYEWVYRFTGRTAQDVIPYLRKLELEEIKELFSPGHEKYLALNLTPREFRRAQWRRCHLALEYARDLAHNARIFQEWGKTERQRSRQTMDGGVRRASLELTIACAQCRICALIVRIKLNWWLIKMAVLPFAAAPRFEALLRLGSGEMLSFYDKIRSTALDLGNLYGDSYRARLTQAG